MADLIDPFGRKIEYLRLSVTDRCDFRCFYCIPGGSKGFTDIDNRLSLEQFVRLVRIFSELGVSKVRPTGEEPLVRRDIGELVRRFAALPGIEELSMSTNASRLADHAVALKAAGVSRISVRYVIPARAGIQSIEKIKHHSDGLSPSVGACCAFTSILALDRNS